MAQIKITALGGLGENGKNMYVVEVDGQIFIFDAGLKYPDIDMYGVDAVVPDISYLIANKDKIVGIFLSHGHEDNIGAIPYLLRNVQANVYGTHFTISLIENLLIANKMDIKKYRLYRINETKCLLFKNLQIKFFNTSHSIPESLGICLYTSDGVIVYATDFNFMPTNENRYETNFSRLTDLGKENVLALMSESVGTSTIGRISNDSLLEHNFNNVLTYAKNRIIIGAYSSDLIRIQKIIDLAVIKLRKIAFVGNKGEKVVETAILNNYLRIPTGYLVSTEDIPNINDNELVIIVHGQREEVYTMMAKMSFGEDPRLQLQASDQIIFICPPVSGTEKLTTDVVNTLYRNGLELTIYDKDILRSSHASRDDLKLMYNLIKPKYIIPIKGEYRHMYEQMLVAKESGFDRSNIILLDNGEVIKFLDGKKETTELVPVGNVFVDGSLIGDVNEDVIKERESLSTEGVLIINVYYDIRERKLIKAPIINSKGIVGKMEDGELQNQIKTLTTRIFENALWKKNYSLDSTKQTIVDELSRLLFKMTKHRPLIMIIPIDASQLVKNENSENDKVILKKKNMTKTSPSKKNPSKKNSKTPGIKKEKNQKN